MENYQEDELYETLAGQIVVTEGILLQKSEAAMRECLSKLKDSFTAESVTTVQDIAKRVMQFYKAEEKEELFENMLYLLYDARGIYAPQVTFLTTSPFDTIAMPIKPDGLTNGIVRAFNEGEEYARVEKVWCDQEVEYAIQEA